jgi:hypothetical protein
MRIYLSGLSCLGLSLFAASASAAQIGWVWGNTPTGAAYTPSAAYQFNSSGGTNTIKRVGAGAYEVSMPGIATTGGAVHVVSYAGKHRCGVSSWGANKVHVRCFSGATATDGQFVALYHNESGGAGAGAHVWADRPTATTPYTANATYSYNSAGGTNTVKRDGTGRYKVTLGKQAGINPYGVLVTAYGGGSGYCSGSYSGEIANDAVLDVRCFNSAGQALDSRFVASLIRKTAVGAASGGIRHGALAWAAPNNQTTFTPDAANSAGSAISGKRLATGSYTLTIPGLPSSNKTTALITGSYAPCNAGGWIGSATQTVLTVRCYNAAGTATNGAFSALYLTNKAWTQPEIDLAADAVNYRLVSKTNPSNGTIEIEGVIKNVGTRTFTAGANQAFAQLFEYNTLLAKVPITSLAAGAVVRVKKQQSWRTGLEFPPSYRVSVVYDPDILLDSNTANDDRNALNNSGTRVGSGIDQLFR